MKYIVPGFFIICFCMCLMACTNESLIQELSAKIPELIEQAKISGLSIAVVRGGEIIWTKGYGITDTRHPAPVTAETVFEAASLSKPIFAYVCLKLVEQRVLDLDRPLVDTFDYERIQHDERHKKITPRTILSQKSGLPNWDREGDLELDREPGERYGYSGEGFVYLQKFVENLTGKTLNQLANEFVFGPFDMSRSGFIWRNEFHESFAEGHNADGVAAPSKRYTEGNAAFSLMTTSVDYAKFLAAITKREGLRKLTFDEMFSTQTRMIGVETRTEYPKEIWSKIAWGLSWGIQENKNDRIYWHWGDNDTYRCFVAFHPEKKTGFVYLTNSENGLSIANEIATPIVGDMHWTTTWLGYETNHSK